jgi:hypothetical protein
VRRTLSLLLSILVAVAGVIGLLLLLQSRDDASLERPAVTQTRTTP